MSIHIALFPAGVREGLGKMIDTEKNALKSASEGFVLMMIDSPIMEQGEKIV
ncbi:MAG TPA: hypothetical protein VFF30_19530 [Nitrososphaerales archaeon]|nr:hypothetical protein [Nitrososphaerales archaeon]